MKEVTGVEGEVIEVVEAEVTEEEVTEVEVTEILIHRSIREAEMIEEIPIHAKVTTDRFYLHLFLLTIQ